MFAITTAIDCKCLWELIGPHVIDRNAISFYLPFFFPDVRCVPSPLETCFRSNTIWCRGWAAYLQLSRACSRRWLFRRSGWKSGAGVGRERGPGPPIHSLAP